MDCGDLTPLSTWRLVALPDIALASSSAPPLSCFTCISWFSSFAFVTSRSAVSPLPCDRLIRQLSAIVSPAASPSSRETLLRWSIAVAVFALLIAFFSPSWGAFRLWAQVPEMGGMIETRPDVARFLAKLNAAGARK